MKENYKQWIYLTFMFIFIAIILLTILSFKYVGEESVPDYLYFFLRYHIFFMFTIAIMGVIFGSVTQIMTSRKMESNQKKFQILKDLYIKSLPKSEQKIISHLVSNKGIATQYELTKIEGLNKLKVSRILIDLESKEIIQKKKIGKINKIYLNNELFKSLN